MVGVTDRRNGGYFVELRGIKPPDLVNAIHARLVPQFSFPKQNKVLLDEPQSQNSPARRIIATFQNRT
jgi:hypothetical protein